MITTVLLFTSVGRSAEPSSRLDCAAGLAPNITILKQNSQLTIIYLKTLTKEQYEEAKKEFGAEYAGLFGADYNEYVNRRSRYFESITLNYDERRALDLYISHLSDEARKGYFKCVETLSTHAYGLWLDFINETDKAVTLHLRYTNAPMTKDPIKVHFTTIGTSTSLQDYTIYKGGSYDVELQRPASDIDIRVSVNGGGLSDSAVSAGRVPLPIYEPVDTPHTEVLQLTRFGNYHLILGNVDCPNCKDLFYAVLTPALPVSSFDSVAYLRSENAGHWYRCSVQTNCETLEFTPTTARSKDTSCRGATTCVIWRVTDDGTQSTDWIEVSYRTHDRRCIKNCEYNHLQNLLQ